MIRKINPEEGLLEFTYFAKTDLDELIGLKSQVKGFDLSMISSIKNSSNIRAVLVSWDFTVIKDIYLRYLYWNNGENLEALDEKVAENTFSSEEFKYSIITRQQKTHCLKCSKIFNTLVAESDLYFGMKELRRAKERLYDVKSCPNCGTTFRIYVVKVL